MRDFIRAALLLTWLVPATCVLMGVQGLALRRRWPLARTLPVFFHRMVCALLRVRIQQIGAPTSRRPLLIIANHLSWLDISVLSTLLPLSFIAKSEVASWPVFGTFARLQRSIFIDRARRQATGAANAVIAERLGQGDAIVLFAEGTTSDGNRVLPFRSALVGGAREAMAASGQSDRPVMVQPLTIDYLRRGGLPLGRADRPSIAWYGAMELVPHLLALMHGPPLDAVAVWGEPIPFGSDSDRKRVTKRAEQAIRDARTALKRGAPLEPFRPF
jgi:1-acyl-sn-glycerol-3-phosphate acyltransferase